MVKLVTPVDVTFGVMVMSLNGGIAVKSKINGAVDDNEDDE